MVASAKYRRRGIMVTLAVTRATTTEADAIARLIQADGSDGHPHFRRLIAGQAPLRDLGDLVHALCAVHGHQPGMVEDALAHGADGDAAPWLTAVAEGFADERGYLARLVAAAGPLPSTPGQAGSAAALVGQRHALAMLARSDRGGCAVGAVAALAGDWRHVRAVLDSAADRFGVTPAPWTLPPDEDAAAVREALAAHPGTQRAMAFGAQQLLAQTRGLWDLLEARASARH